ncbi:MAG: leucine-rich repeat domain-containing protein [Muribaculaceae bacterium]|nr:leucine-rich repeat domain-containing protein [Muribaculaceae bacterium]
MKKKLNLILFALFSIFSLNINAHDFEMVNSDGKTIYYDITSSADLTVSVSYKGGSYGSYTNEYEGDISIPSSVSYNGKTYSVTSIGEDAFWDCDALTSVTIPNSVTSIENNAFRDCEGLTSVTIGNSVTSIGRFAFFSCDGLTSVTIGNSVTSIGVGAFSSCYGLTSVTIGNSVTSIGDYAFKGCRGLTSITIPNSVTSIGYAAFSSCYGLTSVTIGNSVTSIGDYAFRYCGNLTSITIPNSVTSIESSAFEGCNRLTSINVDSNNPSYTSLNGVLFNKGKTELIKYPEGKEGSYTIPNSVTSIGDWAFSYCFGLTSINVDSNNPSYTSLNGVLFNKGKTILITYPGEKEGSYTIPNSVTSIGRYAFFSCDGLTSITIGNSVTSIGSYAFSQCYALTEIYSLSSDPAVCYAGSFSEVDKTIPVYIPFGSKSAYKSASGWKDFTNFIESEFTGVEENEISASDIKVISGNGIEINDYYGRIRIVNLAGQVIKDAYVNGYIQLSLPKGIYIVVTENNSQKVIL